MMLTKKQFFRKYLWYFNLYGNLCFLGIILCGIGVFFSVTYAIGWRRSGNTLLCAVCIAVVIGLVIGAAACLWGGLEISRQFKEKYKYYYVTIKRVKKNGFSDDFFTDGFDSPCYRLVIRQILADLDRKKDYKKLKRRSLFQYVTLQEH